MWVRSMVLTLVASILIRLSASDVVIGVAEMKVALDAHTKYGDYRSTSDPVLLL